MRTEECLRTGFGGTPEFVTMSLSGFDYLLCTLKHDSTFNVALDYELDVGEELDLFINGKGTVYLTGYLRFDNNPPEDWQDYDEDGEDQSAASDSDDELSRLMGVDSEEDDDDDKDDEESDEEIIPVQVREKTRPN